MFSQSLSLWCFFQLYQILSAISYQSEAAKSKSSTEMIESKQVEEEEPGI